MLIESLTAIPIRAPRHPPRSAGGAATSPWSEYGIVVIRTTDGIEGLGEITMGGARSGARQCHEVNSVLAPSLIGRDPLRPRAISLLMDELLTGSDPAKAGVEMAIIDIAARSLGTPAHVLLGGAVRPSVSVRWVITRFAPARLAAEEAVEAVERGFRTIKVKVGRPGTGLDAETVGAIRAAVGPHIAIMVDANGAYRTPASAVREILMLEEFDLELVEQPVRRERLEDMAQVRSRIHTPILADESVRSPADAYAVAKAGAADALAVYVNESGGLLRAADTFAVGAAAGLSGAIGSWLELGIGTAAMAHLALAMPNLENASDIVGPLFHPVDIVNEDFMFEAGEIRPPDGPGLGVTLARDVLERWRLDR